MNFDATLGEDVDNFGLVLGWVLNVTKEFFVNSDSYYIGVLQYSKEVRFIVTLPDGTPGQGLVHFLMEFSVNQEYSLQRFMQLNLCLTKLSWPGNKNLLVLKLSCYLPTCLPNTVFHIVPFKAACTSKG